MTPNLRIDLSHKTERVRFPGTPPLIYLIVMHHYLLFWEKTLKFEADTLFHTNLDLKFQNVPNMGNTQKMQIGKIVSLNSVAKYRNH